MSSTRELPIGIFDSGIGGLTVVRQVRKLLPREDIVYLGDTARVPYGTKSPGTVIRFACEDAHFLLHQKVKAIIVACNTVSAWALPTLTRTFKVPIYGVILPGAQRAVEKSRNHRIGVIGTSTTIRSQAYSTSILERCDSAQVFARPCPLLVPLVEEGWLKHSVTLQVIEEYLRPLLAKKIDTLVLGCTHYPLLKPAFRKVTGGKVHLVDSAESCALYVKESLENKGLQALARKRQGHIQPFVTDETNKFSELAERFLGAKTEAPWKVDLQSFEVPQFSS